MASMYDYFRAFLMLCIVIAALSRGPKTWLKVSSIGILLAAVPALFCPTFILTRVATSVKPDSLHAFLGQASTLEAVVPAVIYALCSASKDKMVFSSLLWSNVVGWGMAAYVASTSHFRDASKFNETHLYFVVIGFCANFAINAWQLFRYWDRAYGAFHLNKVNIILIIDALFSLAGVFFSTQSLELQSMKLDYYHNYIVRTATAKALGQVVLAVMALWYSRIQDKQAIFKTRIAITIGELLCLTVGKVFGSLAPTWKDVGLFSLGVLPGIFAAAGLYFSSASHKYASTERGHYYLRERKD